MNRTERVVLDRALTEDWLLRYQPREIDSKTWGSGLGEFVRETISKVDFIPSYPILQRNTLLLARLAQWCTSQGMPFDVEVILDVATVESWSQSGQLNVRTAKDDLSMIRRLAAAVTKTAPWPPMRTDFPESKTSPPYSGADIKSLWRYAEAQSTSARRRAARALLSLGLGAGLAGMHVALVRTGDIHDEGDVVMVAADSPNARQVPVLAEYEAVVRDLTAGLQPGDFVGGPHSRVGYGGTHLSAQLDAVGPGKTRMIETRRLRNTWILHHLRIGTPINALLLAAGLQPNGQLTRLAQFLPVPDSAEYRRLLRGT